MNSSEDQMWLLWQQRKTELLDEQGYRSNFLVTFFSKYGHRLIEKSYNKDNCFPKVIEVGAGTGEHLSYVRHSFSEYYLTDIDLELLNIAEGRYKENHKIIFKREDALKLNFPDRTFDRLISIYTLEHLPDPHLALKEWSRVVKKGGVISIVIPTEGGLAWNTGRYFSTRNFFKKHGLDLDYIIAREHINACYRIVAFINYYFKHKQVYWFPCFIPSVHLNLVYACNVIND